MDNALKYGLLGVAAPVIDKFMDTSANDARMTALEKDNADYKKQLAAMQQANTGQTKMKTGGKVKSASARADGCCIKGKTRA